MKLLITWLDGSTRTVENVSKIIRASRQQTFVELTLNNGSAMYVSMHAYRTMEPIIEPPKKKTWRD